MTKDSNARATGTHSDTARTPSHQGAILAIILTSYVMIVLDISVVLTGLPKIHQQLGFSETNLAWVQSASPSPTARSVSGDRRIALSDAAKAGEIVAEDKMEYDAAYTAAMERQTFGAHFVEVDVDAMTGEIRMRRMLAVCAAGRILNPQTARSQVIGAMTMGVGAALMEELAVDKRCGFFVNHDMASYEVPVHADIPQQDVIFLDEEDPTVSPLKAKGVGELGICGIAAAIANAIYNATGVRVRDYPITLDKHLSNLPA